LVLNNQVTPVDVTWVLSTDKAHSYYKGGTILYTDVTWVLSTDKAYSYDKGGTFLYTDSGNTSK
jgi:hypothetical protein